MTTMTKEMYKTSPQAQDQWLGRRQGQHLGRFRGQHLGRFQDPRQDQHRHLAAQH